MTLPKLSDLYTTFDTPDQQMWLDQLANSVEGIDTSLYLASDIEYKPRFEHTCCIADAFTVSTDYLTENEILLNHLSHGVQTVFLKFEKVPSSAEFTTLMANIVPSYITTYIQCDEWNDAVTQETGWTQGKDYHLVDGTATQLHTIANDMSNMVTTLTRMAEQPDSKHILLVEISSQYHEEIARLRAINHLVRLLEADDQTLDVEIITHFQQHLSKDVDTQKIANTAMSMISVFGGATGAMPFGFAEVTQEEKRLARNNLHLLTMETKSTSVVDPLCGSTIIEQLTDNIAEPIWNSFIATH